MKRFRVLFVVVALLLVTAGVFAAKSKVTYTLYVYDPSSSTWYELACDVILCASWSTTGTVQATILSNTGSSFYIYYGQNLSDKVFVTSAF